MMKKSFSLVEVLISAVILSFLGVAILNFNSFNKRGIEQQIIKQKALLYISPILFYDKEIETNKKYALFDLVEFESLSDEDRRFLQDIVITGVQTYEDKLYLYSDEKGDHFMEYGYKRIDMDDKKVLPFVYLREQK